MAEAERFWARVEEQAGCLIWTGAVNSDGYGRFVTDAKREISAHKFVHGAAPAGLEWGHVCAVRRCVIHLRAMTHLENVQQSVHRNTKKVDCIRAHSFDAENTYITPEGKRKCKTCRKAEKARWRAKVAA